jgi:hypothetical protein
MQLVDAGPDAGGDEYAGEVGDVAYEGAGA